MEIKPNNDFRRTSLGGGMSWQAAVFFIAMVLLGCLLILANPPRLSRADPNSFVHLLTRAYGRHSQVAIQIRGERINFPSQVVEIGEDFVCVAVLDHEGWSICAPFSEIETVTLNVGTSPQ